MDAVKYEKKWDIRRQKFTCQGCSATFDEDGELLDGSICVNNKMCPRPDKRPIDAPSRSFDDIPQEDSLYKSPEEAVEGLKGMIGRAAEPDPSYEAVVPPADVEEFIRAVEGDQEMYDYHTVHKAPYDAVKNPPHYAQYVIQPITFILRNNIGYCEGNIIKYVCRYNLKGGLEDLQKAREYIDILISSVKEKS